jgi:hypothetical protein
VEAFCRGDHRKPTRVLLRHGLNESDRAAAAVAATKAAAEVAETAASAIEPGDAERAVQAALECQNTEESSGDFMQKSCC